MKKLLMPMLTLLFLVSAAAASNRAERPEKNTTNTSENNDGDNLVTSSGPRTIRVDCDHGQKIAHALRKNADVLDVEIKGTCTEDVIIERDDVTLRGHAAGATLIGGIRVVGSSRVTIRDFTVRESTLPESCIEAISGSALHVENMLVEDCSSRGIRFHSSDGMVVDTTVRNANNVGILARQSSIILEGHVVSADNGLAGVSITDSSSCFSKSVDLEISGSPFGMTVQLSSSFSSPEGVVRLSGNGAAGLLISSHGTFVLGTRLESTGNAFAGLWIDELSSFSAFRGFQPTVNLSGNFFGAFVERGSTLEMIGPTSITGNTVGIVSDEGLLRAANVNATGNAMLDLFLRYGSRANFQNGNTVGVVSCHTDTSIRGDVSCP